MRDEPKLYAIVWSRPRSFQFNDDLRYNIINDFDIDLDCEVLI